MTLVESLSEFNQIASFVIVLPFCLAGMWRLGVSLSHNAYTVWFARDEHLARDTLKQKLVTIRRERNTAN